MIPSAFVALEQLPLTPNGKIDRAALPAAGQASAACKADFVAPRTPVEQTLAEIWAEVLGLERVGVNDHFFRLGGHSLLATVLVSRVRDAFKIDLPVVSLFKAPTVSGLAGVIEQSLIGQADEELLAGFLQEMAELSDEEIRARLADGA
jgi:acyl carrier protein